MDEIHFEILGITVPSEGHYFYDKGYVNSISDATMEINALYGFDNSDYNNDADKDVIGRHCQRLLFDHYIIYLDQFYAMDNIRLRAHEETHALEGMGQLDVLTDRLLEEQNVKINFKEIDDGEIRAELGALYALHARGISSWKIWLMCIDDLLETTTKIYKQSKQSQKRFFIF
tara:strand:+ start:610 stop:1128 length:519 start_codon:yes stop_codon:yes gene_type:complete